MGGTGACERSMLSRRLIAAEPIAESLPIETRMTVRPH
jgi:hypothetical protein